MADPIVVLSAAELRELVTAAVAEALEGSRPASEAPTLLDRAGLARSLGCSLVTIDRLQKQGAPRVMLGDSPRFDLARVLRWLEKREANRETQAPVTGGQATEVAEENQEKRSVRSGFCIDESARTPGRRLTPRNHSNHANGADRGSKAAP